MWGLLSESAGLRTSRADGVNPRIRAREDECPSSIVKALNGLGDAHPYWGRRCALFNLLTQMLTPSQTHHPEITS